MADANPTVRQRELGLRLRKLRTGLGLTVDDVAEKLMCSAAKVSRMETGARRPIPRDVRELCALYGVDEATAAELMKLTRQAREQGWWTQYEDLGLYPYIGLEQEASAITHYSMYYVPALLQTEDYARAIIKAVLPGIAPDVHEQRVEARLRRQQRLEGDNPLRYRVLLDEAALRRPVGGHPLMAAQLARILKLVEASKVTVQVIPFEAGAHAAADSMFVFLEFAGPSLRPVVFVEGLAGGHYHERDADITRYREAIEHLRDAALSPRDSVQFMVGVQQSYASGQRPSS
jgi:transcriptional regulator with XRE-family HTH domain